MTGSSAERRALLRLLRAPGLGPSTLGPIIERAGSAAALIDSGRREWAHQGLSPAQCDAIDSVPSDALDADERWLEGDACHLLPRDDPRYPATLRDIASAPLALFCHGDPDVLAYPQVGIVGARNATPQGEENAQAFAAELARRGIIVTSGLALGIDAAAHRGALSAGQFTVAVCATGLDRVYPARHRDLAREIAASGALVSEFPVGVGVRAEHFPRRNRVISGLSLGILVVEAAERSGSLITARYASEQGRELFAIPGSIHNPMARGCHRLIRDGAKLVETVHDILEEVAPQLADRRPDADAPDSGASPESPAVAAALGDAPATVDQLVQRLGEPAAAVNAQLAEAELLGAVKRLPDGRFAPARPDRTAG